MFAVVLVVMFMPLFGGQNALNYMDALYNSISKGSAYYVADLRVEAEGQRHNDVAVTLADYDGYAGEAMSIGERTPLALLDEGDEGQRQQAQQLLDSLPG